MRYNTVNKREKVKQEVINYLEDYAGYGKLTAMYESDLWVRNGSKDLTPSVKESIRLALCQIAINRKGL